MDRPSVLLHAEDTATGPPRRSRAPAVERIAGWSARHHKTALIGWLLLVAGAVMIGSMLGTKNLNSYDPGQAGRAERVLVGVYAPPGFKSRSLRHLTGSFRPGFRSGRPAGFVMFQGPCVASADYLPVPRRLH